MVLPEEGGRVGRRPMPQRLRKDPGAFFFARHKKRSGTPKPTVFIFSFILLFFCLGAKGKEAKEKVKAVLKKTKK